MVNNNFKRLVQDISTADNYYLSLEGTKSEILKRSFSSAKLANYIVKKGSAVSLKVNNLATSGFMALGMFPIADWYVSTVKGEDFISPVKTLSNLDCQRGDRLFSVIIDMTDITKSDDFITWRKWFLAYLRDFVILFNEMGKKIIKFKNIYSKNSTQKDHWDVFASFRDILIFNVDHNISKYYIDKYIEEFAYFISQKYGNRINNSLNNILTGDYDSPSSQQIKSLYSDIVIKEYNISLSHISHSAIPALKDKSLSNKKRKELYEEKIISADLYADIIFANMVDNAIEAIKSFPLFGEEYYELLNILKNHRTAYKDNITDKEIIQKFGFASAARFSTRKRNALALLNSVLSSVNRDIFIHYICEQVI